MGKIVASSFYFHKISKDKYNYHRNTEVEEFYGYEYECIKDMIFPLFEHNYEKLGSEIRSSVISVHNHRLYKNAIRISKINDEYFIVQFSSDDNEYYKCDQLDGLDDCVTDIIKRINKVNTLKIEPFDKRDKEIYG